MIPIFPLDDATTQEQVIEKINFDAKNTLTPMQKTKNILNEWRNSKKIINMFTANQYYKIENTEIQEKTRDYKNPDGILIKNQNMSNVKLASSFIRTAVDQKVDYSFNRPPVIEITDSASTNDTENPLLKSYKTVWDNFFGDETLETLARVATDSFNKGIGWYYVWVDENQELKIEDVEAETVYPSWINKSRTKLDAAVRDYTVIEYEGTTPKEINKVEFWDKDIVEKYIDEGGELILDIEAQHKVEGELKELSTSIASSHMKSGDAGVSWGKIPFVNLKATDDEMPLLNTVKDNVDTYDKLASKTADALIDDADPIIIIKNISQEVGGLVNAREIIKNTRILSVDADGGAETLSSGIDISSNEIKLTSLENTIKKTLKIIDIAESKFGLNPSGEALKALYQDLDTYINRFEKKFRVSMQELKYFVDMWQSFLGNGTFEQLQAFTLNVKLDRDMMINETALISNTVSLSGLVSQETLDGYNPAVINHEVEQKRREAEQKISESKNELFKFKEDLNKDKGV